MSCVDRQSCLASLNMANTSKAFNMSSTVTTPSRHARGMPLPDIDTRTLYMKPATALTFGGWLTPPQSAHESRRGSLAQSFQSDAPFSNASSIGAVSTPATPMHFSGHGGDPFSQPWPQHTANQMVSHLPAPLGSDHFQSDGLYTPTQPANGALATIGTVGTYPHSGHTDAAESLEMPLRMASEQGFWAPHSHAVLQPGMHISGFVRHSSTAIRTLKTRQWLQSTIDMMDQ